MIRLASVATALASVVAVPADGRLSVVAAVSAGRAVTAACVDLFPLQDAAFLPRAISRSGRYAIGTKEGSGVVRRDLDTGGLEVVLALSDNRRGVTSLATSDDGDLVVASIYDAAAGVSVVLTVQVSTATTTTLEASAPGFPLVDVSGDGRFVVVAAADISVYDRIAATSSIVDSGVHVSRLDMSHDGRFIATVDLRGIAVIDRDAPVSSPPKIFSPYEGADVVRITDDGQELLVNRGYEVGIGGHGSFGVDSIQTATGEVTRLTHLALLDASTDGRYLLVTQLIGGGARLGSERLDRSTGEIQPMSGPAGEALELLLANGSVALAADGLVRPGFPGATLNTGFYWSQLVPYRGRTVFFTVQTQHTAAVATELGDVVDLEHLTLTLSTAPLFEHHVRLTGPTGCVAEVLVRVPVLPATVAPSSRILDTRPDTAVGWTGSKPSAGDVVHLHVEPRNPYYGEGSPVVLVNVTSVDATAPGYVTVFDCDAVPSTSTLNAVPGSIVSNLAPVRAPLGDICVFTQSGTHLVVDVAGTFGSLDFSTPERLLDTRPDTQVGYTGDKPGRDTVVEVPIGQGAVTTLLNVTAVDVTAPGFVTVYPCGTPLPTASNLNLSPGTITSNLVAVSPGADHEVCLYTQAGAHLIVDQAVHASVQQALLDGPRRLLDTRPDTAVGYAGAEPAAGAVVRVAVPTDAPAVLVNLTATDALAPGFVTAYACDAERPATSNLNVVPGSISSHLALVPVSADRSICLFTQSGAHLIADLAGSFYLPPR